MKLSTIIINYNTPEMTVRAIERLSVATRGFKNEIILIENNSVDVVPQEIFTKCAITKIVNKENVGFAKAVNMGLEVARGEFILLLNSDVLCESDVVEKLIAVMDTDQTIAICGPKLVYPDGKVQASFGSLPTIFREAGFVFGFGKYLPNSVVIYPNRLTQSLFSEGHAVDWISGGAMMLRRIALDKFGAFDEKFFFGVEDHDLCLRSTRAGFINWFEPSVKAVHFHGYSTGGKGSVDSLIFEKEGRKYFLLKYWPHNHCLRIISSFGYTLKIFKKRLVKKYADFTS